MLTTRMESPPVIVHPPVFRSLHVPGRRGPGCNPGMDLRRRVSDSLFGVPGGVMVVDEWRVRA